MSGVAKTSGLQPFTTLEDIAAPLMRANIDTDMIIRIERLAGAVRGEFGPWALEMLRYRADGSEDPQFVLNRLPFRRARILVAGDNFGCGSSREHAVWALADFGIRAVIAPSFGDIFFGNCFSNGLLPIRLPQAEVESIAAELEVDPARARLSIDLPAQAITTPSGRRIAFEIEPLRKRMLIEGLDPIGLTLTMDAEIAAFQARDRQTRPWIWAVTP